MILNQLMQLLISYYFLAKNDYEYYY